MMYRCLLGGALLTFTLAAGSPQAPGQSNAKATDPQSAALTSTVKDAMASGKFSRLDGSELKIDSAMTIVPDSAKAGSLSPAVEVLYQVGTTKSQTPVFVSVKTPPSASAATGDLIEGALAGLKTDSGEPALQACAGERTCVRVCGTGPNEYCCKWQCEKPKQE